MKKITAKSIQSHLILYFTIAILAPTLILSIIGTKIIFNQVINRAEMKTLSDLNSAREIYRSKLSHIESIARLTSARSFIVSSLIENNRDTLQQELQQTLLREKLDIFTIVDKKGVVFCRGRNASSFGDTVLQNKFVMGVLEKKEVITGTEIVPSVELAKESPDMVKNVTMKIIHTEKSKQREDCKTARCRY